MRFMKPRRRVLGNVLGMAAALSLAALASPVAYATPQNPVNGTEYVTLQTPQPTSAGKKIEVIEFFAYWCPHCYAFEPLLEAWVRKQGDAIVFKRIHVPKGDLTLPQQKLFFTLEAMGLAEQYQARVFGAIHVQREKFTKDEQVFEWIAKNGLDRKKFIDIYRSFTVQNRLAQTDRAMDAYRIDLWPMVVIDGRYKTSAQMASATMADTAPEIEFHAATIKVMDHLVAKAKAEKK